MQREQKPITIDKGIFGSAHFLCALVWYNGEIRKHSDVTKKPSLGLTPYPPPPIWISAFVALRFNLLSVTQRRETNNSNTLKSLWPRIDLTRER